MYKKIATAAVSAVCAVCMVAGVATADPITPNPQVPHITPSPQAVPPAAGGGQYVPPQDLPIAPPPRPRPQQQQAVAPQPAADEPEQQDTPPPAPPVDPRQLRLGTAIIAAPDFLALDQIHAVQAAADAAEWWTAWAFDQAGYSREASDHAAAAALVGAFGGAYTGGVLATPIPTIGGCIAGLVIGGLAGAAIGGIPTAGVAGPLGAAIGGIVGCMIGAVVVGLPAAVAGLLLGGLAGGAAGGALGDQLDQHPEPATR